VDDLDWLRSLLSSLEGVGHGLEVIFPVHPRTRQKIASLGIGPENNGHIRFLEPLPYLDFLGLQKNAAVVITDSGGIQEETTYLGVPCLTVRENTERPVTITMGTNVLVGRDTAKLSRELDRVISTGRKNNGVPPLWDGHAAERIAKVIAGV
jgi:UDP-N-acetylglucosamine 2-epimerase (non-hydrolysing)